jgi:hypothetical protein
MPKLTQNFVRGKMNKDLDERLLPKGEYRDGQNIQISTSEGNDVGAIEGVLGNVIKNFEGSGDWDDNFGLTNCIAIGGVRDNANNKLYWFITADEADAIVEYDQITNIVAPVVVDTSGVLNFDANYLITGVNILEGLLYWTDNLNEPKVININTFKAGSSQGSNIFSVHTQVYGRNFIESDVTVILDTPGIPPRARAFASIIGGPATGISPILTNLTSTFYGKEGGDVVTVSWTSSGAILNWPANSRVILKSEVTQSNGDVSRYQVVGTFATLVPNAVGGSLTIESITPGITGDSIEWSMLLVEGDPIFKDDFPRFSYRYKYTDGRYSTYAPFSEVAFVAGEFKYLSRDGNNEGMNSVIRKITVDNLPSTPANVIEIEILYKSASSNNVYVIETFEASSLTALDITSGVLGPVVESIQMLRLFDNVPRTAKAQEVVANRVVYGNYLHNYGVNAPNVKVVANEYSNTHGNVGFGELSVKTNREYQVGVSFVDDYGRESPIFTSNTGSVTFNKDNAKNINSIEATLLANSGPDWASYFKFYVKNNSPEYYNLALDKYYDAADGAVWLSFPSSERNKITEGQYITLKKQHNSSTPVSVDNKYKVLSISNEAPDYISSVETALARAQVFAYDSTSFSKFTVGSNRAYFYGPNGQIPDKSDGVPLSGANYAFYSNIQQGNSIQFSSSQGDGKSLMYAIAEGGPTGATISIGGKVYTEYEVVLAQDIDSSDAWLANLATQAEFRATVFEKKKRPLPEFDGRFFTKINPNATFFDNVYAAFYNLANDFVEDIELSISPAADNISSGDTEVYWDDDRSVTAITVLPGSVPYSLDIFRLFVVRTDGTPGPVADQVEYKLSLGSKIKFSYADGSLSPNFYNIIDRINVPYNRTVGNGDGIRYDLQLDRDFDDPQYSSTPTASQVIGVVIYKEVTKTKQTVLSSTNPAIFETEPIELADLDIYWEASGKIAASRFDITQILNWHNCYSFGNGVESDRIRDDFNAPIIGKGVRVNAAIKEPYEEERRGSGLIYSGIFNSISGINNTNQFLIAENITKDLDPSYGTIQKLYARDTNLITLCEDKSLQILADKDALYEANGNAAITSSRNVLGQTIPFAGEYGISKNPESFATFGFRSYYTDKARGAVIRLSADGITVISEKGMSYYFNEQLKSATQPLIGSYDEDNGSYNLRINNKQLSYQEGVDGWVTRLTYAPEFAISLNTEYYTFKGGEMWEHSVAANVASFYGTRSDVVVTTIINDASSSIKNFKTLSYEGDDSWTAVVATKDQNGVVNQWREKEGIYFNFIQGDNTLNAKNFNVQGISALTANMGNANPIDISFAKPMNVSVQNGDAVYYQRAGVTKEIGTVITIDSDRLSFSVNNNTAQNLLAGDFIFVAKPSDINTSGLTGYYSIVTMTNASGTKKELFAVNSEVFISSE